MPEVAGGAAILPGSQFFTMPFRRHSKQSYELNPPDQVYNVIYLGNVLTIMGKGDASVDKPLNVIWKTFNSKRQRREISMKLSVTRSGLKAETKQLGLTEYWAHRVTYCVAPSQYPRIFCWVYKHEGKRMKPELRCHAVLCKKANEPLLISANLNQFLQAALQEYKREKLAMEKARKNSLTGQGPRRKILLQTGSLNFRPPVSRSKSAPRLGSIDEEEEVEEEEEPYEDEEFSDVESLCYRNTPLLGGSTAEDTSSMASSSAQSSCSVTSSLASSISSTIATAILPLISATDQVDYGVLGTEEDEEPSSSSSPPTPTFRRQLSMSRQSQNKLHKQICANIAKSGRAREGKAQAATHIGELPSKSSDDRTACCSSISSSSDPNISSHLEGCKESEDVCACQSTCSSAAKRRLFKNLASNQASISSVGSDGSDSQMSDESGYVDEFVIGKCKRNTSFMKVADKGKCDIAKESEELTPTEQKNAL
uniref:PID domain-containing protein n=1 Tax=Ditylenchus dipsaci TaxID=166011 RepID=A0A915EUS9_9BILA